MANTKYWFILHGDRIEVLVYANRFVNHKCKMRTTCKIQLLVFLVSGSRKNPSNPMHIIKNAKMTVLPREICHDDGKESSQYFLTCTGKKGKIVWWGAIEARQIPLFLGVHNIKWMKILPIDRLISNSPSASVGAAGNFKLMIDGSMHRIMETAAATLLL